MMWLTIIEKLVMGRGAEPKGSRAEGEPSRRGAEPKGSRAEGEPSRRGAEELGGSAFGSRKIESSVPPMVQFTYAPLLWGNRQIEGRPSTTLTPVQI